MNIFDISSIVQLYMTLAILSTLTLGNTSVIINTSLNKYRNSLAKKARGYIATEERNRVSKCPVKNLLIPLSIGEMDVDIDDQSNRPPLSSAFGEVAAGG